MTKSPEFYSLLAEAERRRAKKDLFYLSKFVIGSQFTHPGRKQVWLDHHEELCSWLQTLWQTRHSRPYKTIAKVEWPRGTYKSTLCTWAFPVWCLLNEPDTRILIDSYNINNAYGFLGPVKETFEGKYFQGLFGDRRDPSSWNQEALTIKRPGTWPQASISCGGLNAEKTSQHYDLIIADDTQTKESSTNRTQIDGVIENFRLYMSLLERDGMVLNVGTRWAFDDLGEYIDKMAQEDAAAGRPQRIFINNKACYKTDAAGKFTQDLEFPSILTDDELAHERATQGAFLFSCNYLCRPRSDETAWFKKEWFRGHYHKKEVADLQDANIYMAIDPAGEGTYAGADYNAFAVVAITSRYDLYVLKALQMKGSRDTFFRKVIELYDFYRPRQVGIEKGFRQYELAGWLKSHAISAGRPIQWFDFKTSGQTKPKRVSGLQPYAENGKLFLREEMRDLEEQLLQFPDGQHDDMVDALAYCLEFMSAPIEGQAKEFWRTPGWAKEYEKHLSAGQTIPSELDIMAWKQQDKMRAKRNKIRRLIFGSDATPKSQSFELR